MDARGAPDKISMIVVQKWGEEEEVMQIEFESQPAAMIYKIYGLWAAQESVLISRGLSDSQLTMTEFLTLALMMDGLDALYKKIVDEAKVTESESETTTLLI